MKDNATLHRRTCQLPALRSCAPNHAQAGAGPASTNTMPRSTAQCSAAGVTCPAQGLAQQKLAGRGGGTVTAPLLSRMGATRGERDTRTGWAHTYMGTGMSRQTRKLARRQGPSAPWLVTAKGHGSKRPIKPLNHRYGTQPTHGAPQRGTRSSSHTDRQAPTLSSHIESESEEGEEGVGPTAGTDGNGRGDGMCCAHGCGTHSGWPRQAGRGHTVARHSGVHVFKSIAAGCAVPRHAETHGRHKSTATRGTRLPTKARQRRALATIESHNLWAASTGCGSAPQQDTVQRPCTPGGTSQPSVAKARRRDNSKRCQPCRRGRQAKASAASPAPPQTALLNPAPRKALRVLLPAKAHSN